MSQHGWPETQAASARQDFGLRKERTRKPEHLRKSKPRTYRKRICPYDFCGKVQVRMENHLKTQHPSSDKKYKKMLKKAQYVVISSDSSSCEETDIEIEMKEEEKILKRYIVEERTKRGEVVEHDFHIDLDFDRSDNLVDPPQQPFSVQVLFPAEDSDEDPDWYLKYLKETFVYENEEEEEVSGNEEEESENEEVVDYEDTEINFTMTSKEEDAIMEKFEKWMIGPDGGLTPKRSALQHRSVVITAIKFLEDPKPDIFDSKHLIRWVQDLEDRNRQAGTIKSYLGSIRKFYDFVLVYKPCELAQVIYQNIDATRKVVTNWCANYQKKIMVRSHEKQLEDLANLPTSEDIKKLDDSPYTQKAKTLKNETIPSKKDFCHLRNYIITYLLMNNATRSGGT